MCGHAPRQPTRGGQRVPTNPLEGAHPRRSLASRRQHPWRAVEMQPLVSGADRAICAHIGEQEVDGPLPGRGEDLKALADDRRVDCHALNAHETDATAVRS